MSSDSSPLQLTAQLIVADFAEAINGKLYIQGAGWARITPNMPVFIALATVIRVPYSMTNTPHKVTLRLCTDDGESYPPDQPFEVEMDVEVGRPPGMLHGEESIVPFAAKLNGLAFEPGAYRFEAAVEGAVIGAVSFVSRG